MSDLAPSAAHNLGALTGGLALIAEELAARLHTTHARPGEGWRDCQANSRACQDAARLLDEAERMAGAPVQDDAFTDHMALYGESVTLLGGQP